MKSAVSRAWPIFLSSRQHVPDRPGTDIHDPDRPANVGDILHGRINAHALATVAKKSGTVTGPSLIAIPSGLVLPWTVPPLMPPPHRTVLQAFGK